MMDWRVWLGKPARTFFTESAHFSDVFEGTGSLTGHTTEHLPKCPQGQSAPMRSKCSDHRSTDVAAKFLDAFI